MLFWGNFVLKKLQNNFKKFFNFYSGVEFLNTQTHGRMSAQKLLESAKTKLFCNAEHAKQTLFTCFFAHFLKCFLIIYIFFFIAITGHNSAQKSIKVNSDRAKLLTFRMSALEYPDWEIRA